MRSARVLCCLLITATILMAQSLNVHTSDGQVTSFSLEDIQSITFTDSPVDVVTWITVPAGPYTFGEDDEIMTHIDYDFEIMEHEVTNAQFSTFLNEANDAGDLLLTAFSVDGIYDGDDLIPADVYTYYKLGELNSRISWDGEDFLVDAGYEVHPVTEVTWFGAWAFTQHYDLELPTEQEWEKSARSDTGSDYPWGDAAPECSVANFLDCIGNTQTVGLASGESPFGLGELCGNALEWTASTENASSIYRVIKGGGFSSSGDELKSWYRSSEIPAANAGDIGFRCIRLAE